jgi:16S rRNA processing protein RimM
VAARTSPDDPAGWVVVGEIVKPHGLEGEVSVLPLTDFPERFSPGRVLQLRRPTGEARPLKISGVRPHRGRLLVLFEGVEGLEAAEALRGSDLCVLPGDEPVRPPGYVLHFELEGFEVADVSGRSLGRAEGLAEAGGLPLLAVRTPLGLRDVPFRHPIVVAVDREARKVVLDPPAGLLD